ncbi:hypothetical protein CD29_16860 [Ureibacillus manganicus DSM 26584]|uniref:Uncharacterized protein n=1 Tax=Ureibacillus manganicus DSM 26584 TaxID=1384049 RepID=A0A0A3HYS9_9BACL|nr:hypothetical protein CD29_16860 [Ureibacillus manganicus DSM 26584]
MVGGVRRYGIRVNYYLVLVRYGIVLKRFEVLKMCVLRVLEKNDKLLEITRGLLEKSGSY